ncbi:hypothetical protein C8R43DRAFT_1239396 [Mycena crocata]|nr:hypothetical protein C8R43DRAFT_1239396 [Mycena crocata]
MSPILATFTALQPALHLVDVAPPMPCLQRALVRQPTRSNHGVHRICPAFVRATRPPDTPVPVSVPLQLCFNQRRHARYTRASAGPVYRRCRLFLFTHTLIARTRTKLACEGYPNCDDTDDDHNYTVMQLRTRPAVPLFDYCSHTYMCRCSARFVSAVPALICTLTLSKSQTPALRIKQASMPSRVSSVKLNASAADALLMFLLSTLHASHFARSTLRRLTFDRPHSLASTHAALILP